MKLEGVFLDSRLGRRIFLLFVLAATVPIVLLSALAYGGWTAYAERHENEQLTQATRYFALTVFDRLLAAKSALATAEVQAPDASASTRLRGIFRAVSIEPAAAATPAGTVGTGDLFWQRHPRDEAPARVTVRLRDAETGQVRVGELEPAYLWSEAFDDVSGEQVCVFAGAGEQIFCSSSPDGAFDEARPANAASASWDLFLRHEFGVDDWRFTVQRGAGRAREGFSFLHIGWQVVAASVLLVITLSLVLVRRTTVPLQKLTAGTRRLAGGDYDVRVDVRSADEFGELGTAFNDMAERIGRQALQLRHRAAHDSLTGLLNRAGLHDVLSDAVDAGRPFALLWIDLDRFKAVNDTLGHEAGDELLGVISQRLVQGLPPDAPLARLGGDEFVALVQGMARERIDEMAAALVAQVGQPVWLRGMQLTTGASLGVAEFPADGRTAADLLRHADMAMYAAKARGRAQVARFETALGSAAEEHAELSRDLARAVERHELRLHYQPRVDARTGEVRAVEALVRWQHPTRGLLMPGAFIELAEETGLVVPIGRWVLHEACRQMAAWRAVAVPLNVVAVNLSVHQLRTPSLVDEVFGALRSHGLASSDLELEVTESVMVGDVQATSALLARLRAGGVRIAIDDFGTGYSSMAYLRYLPVDVLKIDRAFVKDIGSDASADIVVRAIVGLAGSLGLATVAEGVETAAQARLLVEMGCGELQGYHFARPLPPQEVPATIGARALEALAG